MPGQPITFDEYFRIKDKYEELVAQMLISQNVQPKLLAPLESILLHCDLEGSNDYYFCIEAFHQTLGLTSV